LRNERLENGSHAFRHILEQLEDGEERVHAGRVVRLLLAQVDQDLLGHVLNPLEVEGLQHEGRIGRTEHGFKQHPHQTLLSHFGGDANQEFADESQGDHPDFEVQALVVDAVVLLLDFSEVLELVPADEHDVFVDGLGLADQL